jgi:hypothetical protein
MRNLIHASFTCAMVRRQDYDCHRRPRSRTEPVPAGGRSRQEPLAVMPPPSDGSDRSPADLSLRANRTPGAFA